MEGRVTPKIEFNVQEDITSQTLNLQQLQYEFERDMPELFVQIVGGNDNNFIAYFDKNLSTEEAAAVNTIVADHTAAMQWGPVIYGLVDDEVKNKDYRDIDYTIEPRPNLVPDRYFVQGELQRVTWYSDSSKNLKVLETIIEYTRDGFGFAASRTTTRSWFDYMGMALPDIKVTNKTYSTLDMIKEGKARRGNIVDGVQIPVFSFLQEAAIVDGATYGLNPQTVLLVGREFMDRFEVEFAKFIDNSSSITDLADPNFNRKTVVVEFEKAATSTDTWLNYTPAALGGARILDYLVGEFSI